MRWGTLSATVHSSFRRSAKNAKMERSIRKHGLICLEYMVRIVNQTARIAMKLCQDYVKLFSASTGYKKFRESAAYVCIFIDILWSRLHV